MFTLILALAGARPAAAETNPLDAALAWLTGLWQAATGDAGTASTEGDRGAGLDPNGLQIDRGAGLDPNGGAPTLGPGSAP
jgi:hypothetical protein